MTFFAKITEKPCQYGPNVPWMLWKILASISKQNTLRLKTDATVNELFLFRWLEAGGEVGVSTSIVWK